MLDIGLEVKILRERMQMSAKELSERIGLSQSQMSRLEKGQRRIDTKVLAKIADVLGVEPSYFFGSGDEPAGGVIAPTRPSSVGKRIRQERRQRHLSSDDLALKLNIPKARLLAIEEGKRGLDPLLAEKVQRHLRLPKDFFLRSQQETIDALEGQVERLNQELAESRRGSAAGAGESSGSERAVPILSTLVGGYPMVFDSGGQPTGEPDSFVVLPGLQDPSAFGVLVVGDSMLSPTRPSFAEGDLIVLGEGALKSRDFALVRWSLADPGSTDETQNRPSEAAAERIDFRQVFFESAAGSRVRLQPLNLDHGADHCGRDAILGMWRLIAHVARF